MKRRAPGRGRGGGLPKGLFLRAGWLLLAYLVLEAAGLRAYTCFLGGLTAPGDRFAELRILIGIVYLAGYLGAVILAPILVMAGLLAWLFDRRVPHPGTPV